MTTIQKITDEWIERRKPRERRKVERQDTERRSNYDASHANISSAPYDQNTIDAQLKALKTLKTLKRD